MKILPSTGLEILEFDKVINCIKSQCMSEQGREACNKILPGVELPVIEHELCIVSDVKSLIDEGANLLNSAFPRLEKIIKNLAVEGYVLPGEDIFQIWHVIVLSREISTLFDADRKVEYPALYSVVSQISDPDYSIHKIETILDEEGHVRSDASPVLINIDADRKNKKAQGSKIFQVIIRKYAKDGWLVDTLESVRNDRRVLAVHAEFKRKIRGIVHDQSATGRTAYVEPEEMIEINNDLFELQAARRAEEYRLLATLCEELRPFIEDFEAAEQTLVDIDVYSAKARYARQIDGEKPVVQEEPILGIQQARHPLLLLKNKSEGKETIPFDLALHGHNRMLLLSGPNAGGKSILMKSVGLLQVMLQSGLLVPVDDDSVFGIFKKICVELGDRQSIESDLSTYSSRLVDMKLFLQESNAETLVLIDEFGSGTDPKLGGAIAEGILNQLYQNEAYGVLTTHYSELKVYAYKKKGVVNGAMVFDKDNMAPTYKLRIGKPGSSFTFEIAEKTGLPKRVIAYARNRAGKNTRALEELIIDLEAQKQQLDQQVADISGKEAKLDRLMRNYEKMQTDLTAQRKRMKLEQKERDYQHLSQLNKELEKSIRVAKEKANLKASQKQLAKVKEARREARESISSINEDLSLRAKRDVNREWRVGDPVRIGGATHAGRIERMDKKSATVIVGQLRMTVPLKDLEPAGEPISINPTLSIKSNVSKQSGFNTLLDLRGMRAQEADSLMEKFMDDALLAGVNLLRIVHGKGTGALKRMVDQKLNEYPVVHIDQPVDQHGGSGVTIVTL